MKWPRGRAPNFPQLSEQVAFRKKTFHHFKYTQLLRVQGDTEMISYPTTSPGRCQGGTTWTGSSQNPRCPSQMTGPQELGLEPFRPASGELWNQWSISSDPSLRCAQNKTKSKNCLIKQSLLLHKQVNKLFTCREQLRWLTTGEVTLLHVLL